MIAYFYIKLKSLKDIRTFPFTLYVYKEKENLYTEYLKANTPLTQDSYNLLKYIEDNKTGKIAIKLSQRMTYLATVGELSEYTPQEANQIREKINILKEHEKAVETNQKEERTRLPLRTVLTKAIDQDDFLPIILRAQKEISAFPVNLSHTISLARHFAMTHLDKDNLTNRIVALSFFFAKKLGIEDYKKQADLICASFLANIGLTSISPNIIHESFEEVTSDQREQYYKHVKVSRMLIEKSGVQLSEECKAIIDHHHEKHDGSGMPGQISQAGLSLESEILEFISHILEFSTGLINGEKSPLSSVVYMVDAQAGVGGLNTNYSDKIKPHITSVLSL